jgi:hypothetical protein
VAIPEEVPVPTTELRIGEPPLLFWARGEFVRGLPKRALLLLFLARGE